MYFHVNAYSPKLLNVVPSNLHRCKGHMIWREMGNILCESFNVFSCKCIFSLTIGRSNFKLTQVHRSHDVEGNGQHFV